MLRRHLTTLKSNTLREVTLADPDMGHGSTHDALLLQAQLPTTSYHVREGSSTEHVGARHRLLNGRV